MAGERVVFESTGDGSYRLTADDDAGACCSHDEVYTCCGPDQGG